MSLRQQIGQYGEDLACYYLQQRGLKLLARRYRVRGGELDLVMQEADCLCFIEVRVRKQSSFATASESVHRSKQYKTIHAAQCFLQRYPQYATWECRFDVLAVDYRQLDLDADFASVLQQQGTDKQNLYIQWIRAAYTS